MTPNEQLIHRFYTAFQQRDFRNMQKFLLSFFAIVLSQTQLYSQQAENSNWHFGSGVGMNILGGNITIESSAISVGSGVTPASISNASGQFQCSSNGLVVRNFNGDVIDNGQFNTAATENLFMPMPNNPGKYYLFRSRNLAVDYSIVDMNLNDGQGGIAENEKEIVIHNRLSQLMITQHANLEDFWLITADNNNGNSDNIFMRSWVVNENSITQMQLFSVGYNLAGFFAGLDDAKISPTCDKIAVVYKGHYVTVYQFNNETGIVSNPLPYAINTLTSSSLRCNLEFSPNGQYLYVIGDFYKIDRFNLETWTSAAINASKVTISEAVAQTWRDIKLSPYGELYLYNSNAGVIDRVIDPNVEGTEFGTESTGVSVDPSSVFFPNTPYLVCGVVLSQPSISATNVCLGDTTWLTYIFPIEGEEIFWDFGTTDVIYASNDQNPNWVIFQQAGTYVAMLNMFYGGEWHQFTHLVTISVPPVVDLGPDQQLCQGEFVTLGVVNEGYSYHWSSGHTTSQMNVAIGGDFTLVINNQGCIVSDTVSVVIIPQIIFFSIDDVVICGEGQTVILNATNSTADAYLWNTGAQTPIIEVQTTGSYHVILNNACFTVSDTVEVEFVVFPEILLPDDITACQNESVTIQALYTNGAFIWNTGSIASQIVVNSPGTYTFYINHLGCFAQDEIVVDFLPEVSVTLQDYVFCDNESVQLTSFHAAATDYLWSNGATTPQITVSSGGNYWVVVSNFCFTAVDTATVQHINFPSPLLPASISACEGDTVFVNTAYALGDITWSNGVSGPAISITEAGDYSVYINHLGCEAEADISVNFQESVSLNDFEMPNVFTPNGDSWNNEFRPILVSDPQFLVCGSSNIKVELIIYNRWGNKITNGDCVWDGNGSDGQILPDGTYYYILNLESNCSQRNVTRQIAGQVTLLR